MFNETIFRNDRNCFGSGVMVYISESLKAKRRPDLEFDSGELIWTEIEFPNYKLLLCTVYRSPGTGQPFWQNFEHSIEQAFNYSSYIVITGDLNVDLLVENNHTLNDILTVFYLKNVINEPTRINQITGIHTLLDPVLISGDCNATFSEVIDIRRDISDHNATRVVLEIPHYIQKNYQRTVWLYKNADYNKFNELVANYDWETNFLNFGDNINEMTNHFTQVYIEMAKESIPNKVINIRPTDKPWFNSEIRRQIRIRDRLHKKLRSCSSVRNLNAFKHQRNKVNNMLIHAKEQFYLNANGLLEEKFSNPKSFWSLVKKVFVIAAHQLYPH